MKRREVQLEITDHAVLRYIERALGGDVDAIRQHLHLHALQGAEFGARAVRHGGVRLVLRDRAVGPDGVVRVQLRTVLGQHMARGLD